MNSSGAVLTCEVSFTCTEYLKVMPSVYFTPELRMYLFDNFPQFKTENNLKHKKVPLTFDGSDSIELIFLDSRPLYTPVAIKLNFYRIVRKRMYSFKACFELSKQIIEASFD